MSLYPRRRRMIDAEQIHSLFMSGIVGVVAWAPSGEIHDANDGFLEMFGRTRAELDRGTLDWAEISGSASASHEASVLVDAQGPIDREYRHRAGSPVHVRIRSTCFLEDPRDRLSVVVDISAQKRVEAERDAILDRERSARAEAERAVQLREEILAVVSHDLRNPLSTIALAIPLLQRTTDLAQVRTQACVLQRAVDRMNRLIQDLLDVSRIASGGLEVDPVPVAIAPVLSELCTLLGPQALQKGQRLECEIPDAGLVVLADASRIMQVLANLVVNAIKFTAENGRIRIHTRVASDRVVVSVEDSGRGIDAEDLPHVFDRFWQSRRARRGGVGLGLPIAKGIVEAHGGTIWAQSSPGAGTTFSFTLPRVAAEH